MLGIILQDPNGMVWDADFLPSGLYQSTSLGAIPGQTFILVNDFSGSLFTWSITIVAGGTQILVTRVSGFQPSAPTIIYGSYGFAFVVNNGTLGRIIASPTPPTPPPPLATGPIAISPIRSQPSPGNQPPEGNPYVYYNVPQEFPMDPLKFCLRWANYAWAYQAPGQGANSPFAPAPPPP